MQNSTSWLCEASVRVSVWNVEVLPAHFSEMATTAKLCDIAKVFLLHKHAGLEFAVYLYCQFIHMETISIAVFLSHHY